MALPVSKVRGLVKITVVELSFLEKFTSYFLNVRGGFSLWPSAASGSSYETDRY